MASSPPNRSADDIVDTMPLLASSGGSSDESNSGRRFLRQQSLRQAARFLRQASSRRLMREPSMLVRETAAEQLEERQSDWAYSKPVVVLDIIWNFAFVVVATTVLVLSRLESPEMPLRLWIVGYAMQCLLHMVCVCFEFRRRQNRRFLGVNSGDGGIGSAGISSPRREDSSQYVSLADHLNEEGTGSVAKHLESANTMFSFIWWIIGFYWVSAGGQSLAHASPQLYWMCIIFLGFDVFFVVFCVALACIIGIAVCCCLPCIIALLYAVADQVVLLHSSLLCVWGMFHVHFNPSSHSNPLVMFILLPHRKEAADLCSYQQGSPYELLSSNFQLLPLKQLQDEMNYCFSIFFIDPNLLDFFQCGYTGVVGFLPLPSLFSCDMLLKQDGASKEDIEQLSKFKFRRVSNEKIAADEQGPHGGVMTECGTDSPIEHVLSPEDAECCICLSSYDDGAELRQLPCGHHFHCSCIDKWLFINATCPLCKYNILKSSSNEQGEV